MNLSEHLEDLRKQHDLTQDQLAEKLTVTRQAISRWERGLAYPTVDNLKALSQLYQVSLDTLLLDEPFTGLDPETLTRAAALLRQRAAGKNVLLATHDQAAIQALGWQMIRL